MGVVSECGTLQDVIITASLWGRKYNRRREEKEEGGRRRSRSKQGIRRVKSDEGTLYDMSVNYY